MQRTQVYQLVALAAVAREPSLARRLALRGSSAMWLTHFPPRIPADLDFIDLDRPVSDPSRGAAELDTAIRKTLTRAFKEAVGGDSEALAEAQRVVKFDVCPWYMPFKTVCQNLLGTTLTLNVCGLEFVVAEKLATVADQQRRQCFRPRDAYDIRDLIKAHRDLEISAVAACLVAKHAVEQRTAVESQLFKGSLRTWVAPRYAAHRQYHDWEHVWATVETLAERCSSLPLSSALSPADA